jgi:hypothetical protein
MNKLHPKFERFTVHSLLKETIKTTAAKKIIPGILRKRQSKHISADEIKDYMLNAKKSIRKMLCIGNKSSIHHQAAT